MGTKNNELSQAKTYFFIIGKNRQVDAIPGEMIDIVDEEKQKAKLIFLHTFR